MRHILSLLVLFSVSSFASADVIVKSSVRTSHSVRESSNSTLTQYGSGTVIKKEKDKFYVLSCAHIAEHKGKINTGKLTVTTWDSKVYDGKVVNYDKARDMSLILVKADADVEAAEISKKEDYKAGTEVTKCGYPGGGDRVISSGKCADWYTVSSEDNSIVYTVANVKSSSGDSGGGLFKGKILVGVVWGGIDNSLRATRVKDIWIFLDACKLKP